MKQREEVVHAVRPGGIGYFNLMRGVAMALILLGHSVNQTFTTPYLAQTMHLSTRPFSGASTVFGGGLMGMLFLVSGYGFFKRSPKKCWKIQKRMLLYPYFVTAIFVLAVKAILAVLERRPFMEHGGEYILTYLLGLNWERGGRLFGIPVQSVNIFWFVLALFIGWNLFNLICQKKDETLRFGLVLLTVLAGTVLNRISPVWPYCFSIGCMATGFIYIGNWMRESKWLTQKLFIWEWGILLTISGVCLTFGTVSAVDGIWKLGIIDWLGSACLGMLFFRAYAAVMDVIPQNGFVIFLEKVGQRTMWVLCIHAFEKIIVPWYRIGMIGTYLFPEQSAVIQLCEGLAIFVLRVCLIFVLYKICSRSWRKIRSLRLA